MNLLDVNVLIALAQADHPHHQRARSWWAETVAAGEPFTVPEMVAVGFLRIVTARRPGLASTPVAEAQGFLRALTAHPLHLVWVSKPDLLSVLSTVLEESGVVGPRVSDAWIAAMAMSYGATVVTFDRDFRRFDGLRRRELL